MAIRHVRLSQRGKEKLLRLKGITGIDQWNILCRWALAVSLAESTQPPDYEVPADSNVEMTWGVFGGPDADVYSGLIKERALQDGLDPTNELVLTGYFRRHLHRGIDYLASLKMSRVEDLCKLLPQRQDTNQK